MTREENTPQQDLPFPSSRQEDDPNASLEREEKTASGAPASPVSPDDALDTDVTPEVPRDTEEGESAGVAADATGITAEAPDTQPDPSRGAPVATPPGLEPITDLGVDLDRTALAISAGEFSAEGTGPCGDAYRRLRAATGDAAIDRWSRFIELAGMLWEAGHRDASITMMEHASLTLEVPSLFERRLADSLVEARELKRIHDAEAKFLAGESEAARSMVKDLTSDDGRFYVDLLKQKIAERNRWRRITFTVSGFCLAALLAMSFIGGAQKIRALAENEPDLALPDFPTEAYRNMLSGPIEPGPTPGPDATSGAIDTRVEEPSGDQDAATETAPAAAEDPLPPEELPDPKFIESCAIGFAAIDLAKEMAVAREDAAGAQNTRVFEGKIEAACHKLGLRRDVMRSLAPDVDPTKIENTARSLLSDG